MSLRARLLNQWLRRVEKPALTRATDPHRMRARFETNARLFFHAPRGTRHQWQVLAHANRRIDVLELVPRTLTSDIVLLYLHGGAFVFGSPRTHAALVAQLGQRLGARAVLPRYRLAPEAPFPAAPDDARTAWDGLIASGVRPDQIFIGGDSAGGCLALTLLADLIRDKAPLPAGVFCFSPLTDITCCSGSFQANKQVEALLPADRAAEMTGMYLAGHSRDDPRVNPQRADYHGAPPVWITYGDTEILADDARQMARTLRRDGVEVTLTEEHDLPHVWPLFHNTLPEARMTLDALARWIRAQPSAPVES